MISLAFLGVVILVLILMLASPSQQSDSQQKTSEQIDNPEHAKAAAIGRAVGRAYGNARGSVALRVLVFGAGPLAVESIHVGYSIAYATWHWHPVFAILTGLAAFAVPVLIVGSIGSVRQKLDKAAGNFLDLLSAALVGAVAYEVASSVFDLDCVFHAIVNRVSTGW